MYPVREDRQVHVMIIYGNDMVMGMESKRPSGIKEKHRQMKALYVRNT